MLVGFPITGEVPVFLLPISSVILGERVHPLYGCSSFKPEAC